MKGSQTSNQEAIDSRFIEEISKIEQIALGEGAATCQACGSTFHGGDPVRAYVYCPASEHTYHLAYPLCPTHTHPTVFTLGVRELLVEGRIGRCIDTATQSSWPVLLAPDVLAVSHTDTTGLHPTDHTQDTPSTAPQPTGATEPLSQEASE